MTQEYEALAAKLERISKEQRRERGDMMFLGHPDPWLAEASTAIRALVAEKERPREAGGINKLCSEINMKALGTANRTNSAYREALEQIAKVSDEPRKDWSRHVGDIARKALEPRHD